MTLREFLTEQYITNPDAMGYVAVNGAITTDWDQQLKYGDTIEVDWPHVEIKWWKLGENHEQL